MNYLGGIASAGSLGSLDPENRKKIQENAELLEAVLKEADELKGLGSTSSELMKFDDVIRRYNKNITPDEIKAWVWYKRKQGVPMTGWEKYHLPKSTEAKELHRLVSEQVLFYFKGEFLPFAIYTYGNMYDRLGQLEKDREHILKNWTPECYDKHREAIEKATPPLLSVRNPDPSERPVITLISDFAGNTELFYINQVREEYMDIENAVQLKKVNGQITGVSQKDKIALKLNAGENYSLQTVFILWVFALKETDFVKSNAIDIVSYYIGNKALRDDRLTKEEKSELKANARIEGEQLFSKFLYEVLAFEDQQRLDYSWNRIYNGQSDINYAKVPVGFACSNRFKSGILQITDIQREGVAFMEAMGSGINAFDVGVGKTMCAIVNLAHMLYCGKCSRPLVVVPKPTYRKWVNEIMGYTDRKTGEFVHGVLSHTGISLNDWYNLGTGIKADFTKAVPKGSITLVTYEGFKRLGFGDGISDGLFTELVNILGQSKEGTQRDKEIEYQKYWDMIGTGLKDTLADVDTLGFDYVVVDEAHRCKNVFSQVKADEDGNKRYAMQSAVSETGQKAFLILNYIQRKFGRNTMLLTATPFTNSPLEIYSMLSLVAHNSIRENSIESIKSFFDLFVLPTVEWTANYKEEIVEKEVIKSFNNRKILQKLIYNHILYKTGEEAGVVRPKKVNLPLLYDFESEPAQRLPRDKQLQTFISMTEKQRINQNQIVSLAKHSTEGKLDMGNLFRALAYSLDNALSPFIYQGEPEDYKDFVENSPKIKYVCECIRSVKHWHQAKGESCSGQVVYMNRGKAFFPLIKEYLEKELGFKRGVAYDRIKVDEVEIIRSEISDARKENVKEAFLDGAVKVILGTATIREGIDLQKRGTVIYNCYPEWNPTDLRQLEGRIWRQGNLFKYVRIVMPLVQDSMDVFVFQKLEEKTSRINDIWFKGGRGNVLDLESLNPEEIKLALITDVKRLAAMLFDQEKAQMEREYKRIGVAIESLKEVDSSIKQYRHYRERSIEAISGFYDSLKASSRYSSQEPKTDHSLLQLKKYMEIEEAIEAFKASSEQGDRDIIALGRKIEASYELLGIYFRNSYSITYFKEYASKVRKTEKTILNPKGYSLASDLNPLMEQYLADKKALEGRAKTYAGGVNSERFAELCKETQEKKSALQVEGKTAEKRAVEFASLNYLLEYRMNLPATKESESKNSINLLELEALALEVELQILSL